MVFPRDEAIDWLASRNGQHCSRCRQHRRAQQDVFLFIHLDLYRTMVTEESFKFGRKVRHEEGKREVREEMLSFYFN